VILIISQNKQKSNKKTTEEREDLKSMHRKFIKNFVFLLLKGVIYDRW